MKNANDLVSDAVNEINQQQMKDCEQQVKKLVQSIIDKQAKIKVLLVEIAEQKEQLKKLQVPETVTLEI